LLTLEFFGILSAGFLLGLRHSLEPDHIAAVSTIVSRGGPWRRAVLVGLTWGTGHTLTLFLVTLVTLGLKIAVPATLSRFLEIAVGVMLAVLGILILKRVFADGLHKYNWDHSVGAGHSHGKAKHVPQHRAPFLIGLMHGLAGSASLLVLVVASMSSLTQSLLFSLIFGVGAMVGMALAGLVMSVPFLFASEQRWLQPVLVLAPAFISIILGLNIVHSNWASY